MRMRREDRHRFLFFFLCVSFLCSSLFVIVVSSNNFTATTLDSAVRSYAAEALDGKRTGVVYPVTLPPELAGVEATVVRLRAGRLKRKGTNSSFIFHIPPEVVVIPYETRVAIVFENLGNLSSTFYRIPNYSLVSPVVGLLAFSPQTDAGGEAPPEEISLVAEGIPIMVSFPPVNLPAGFNSTLKCVEFQLNNSVSISDAEVSPEANTCLASGTGHFSIIVPTATSPPPPEKRRKISKLWSLGAAVAGSLVGLALVGTVATWVHKVVQEKNIKKMEKEADDGEALEFSWIVGSRMHHQIPNEEAIDSDPKRLKISNICKIHHPCCKLLFCLESPTRFTDRESNSSKTEELVKEKKARRISKRRGER